MATSRGFTNLISSLRRSNKSINDSFIDDIADFNNIPRFNIYEEILRDRGAGRQFRQHYEEIFGNDQLNILVRLIRRRRLRPRHISRLKRLYYEGTIFGSFGELKPTTVGIGRKVEVDHLFEDRSYRIYADGSDTALTFGQRSLISNFDRSGSSPDPFHNLEFNRTDSLSAIVPIDDIVMHQLLLNDIFAPYVHVTKTARIAQLIPPGLETSIPITDLWNRHRYGLREFFPHNSFDEMEVEVRDALIEAVLHGVENNREHDLLCEILMSSTNRQDHIEIIEELRVSRDNIDTDSPIYEKIESLLDDILELGDEDNSLFLSVSASQFGTD